MGHLDVLGHQGQAAPLDSDRFRPGCHDDAQVQEALLLATLHVTASNSQPLAQVLLCLRVLLPRPRLPGRPARAAAPRCRWATALSS